MKKFLFFFILCSVFLGQSNFTFAAQQNGSPVVTESTLSIDVNTDDKSIVLEVYDQQNKRVAGPTTVAGTSPIKGTIGISNLARGTTFVLKVKDNDAKLGGDSFSVNFTTVKTDTRVSGSGDWYYSVGIILANYDTDRNKSLFVFTTESSCNTARTLKIDELYAAESVAGGGVKNSTITPCFQSKTVPTKKEFEGKLQSIDGLTGSKSLYYFTYGYKTGKVFNRSQGFATEKECRDSQVIYQDQVVMSCTPLASAPTEPADWMSLLDKRDVDPQKEPTPFDSEYKLLAPIGNLSSIGGDSDNKIGDYLNIILMIAIGLCGALAVIMIVVRGVQYMGDESVFGKTEAKHHIMQAVLGLLLALGAYAILNTINPKLVGGSLTFNSVNIELDGSPMTSNDAVPPPGTKVARCPEGIVTIETSGGKLPVCKSFSTNLKSLIDTAWAEGYKIYGYGFRTSASQINLRKRHCGGDSYYNIYLKPSGKCIPPTATPGNSMHESGLAFDFTCEGASITSRSNKCFIWLQKNASKYGLKNLSSEPWHWSTNGN